MDFSFVTWLFDTPQKYIDFSNCIYLHWVGNYKRNYKSLSSNSVTQTKMKGCMNPSKCFYYFDHYTHCKINSSSRKLSLYFTIIKCSNEFTFWWQKKQRGRAGGEGLNTITPIIISNSEELFHALHWKNISQNMSQLTVNTDQITPCEGTDYLDISEVHNALYSLT